MGYFERIYASSLPHRAVAVYMYLHDRADRDKSCWPAIPTMARACLKIHSRHLHAPLCVIFAPNSGYIARYAPFIWHKSPTNCDAHLSESNFQTRSRELGMSRSTIKRALRDLVRAGYLKKEFRYRENGSYTSNLYTLL